MKKPLTERQQEALEALVCLKRPGIVGGDQTDPLCVGRTQTIESLEKMGLVRVLGKWVSLTQAGQNFVKA